MKSYILYSDQPLYPKIESNWKLAYHCRDNVLVFDGADAEVQCAEALKHINYKQNGIYAVKINEAYAKEIVSEKYLQDDNICEIWLGGGRWWEPKQQYYEGWEKYKCYDVMPRPGHDIHAYDADRDMFDVLII